MHVELAQSTRFLVPIVRSAHVRDSGSLRRPHGDQRNTPLDTRGVIRGLLQCTPVGPGRVVRVVLTPRLRTSLRLGYLNSLRTQPLLGPRTYPSVHSGGVRNTLVVFADYVQLPEHSRIAPTMPFWWASVRIMDASTRKIRRIEYILSCILKQPRERW